MADTPDTKPTVTPDPARRVPLRFWLYTAGSALLAGALGYGVAYGLGQRALKQASAELEHQAQAHATAKRQTDQEVEVLRQRVRLLGARRVLHQALLALEQSNFGIAQQRLQAASAALVKEANSDEKLVTVATRAGDFKVNVAADIGEQRTALAALLTSLDEAIGAPE